MKNLLGDQITIGDKEGEISLATFTSAFEKFPSKIELEHYVNKRIADIISDDLSLEKDYEQKYTRYLKRKLSKNTIFSDVDSNEIEEKRFTYTLEKLKDMLNATVCPEEYQWQKEILKIILVLYPQYIRAFRETLLPKVNGH